MIAFQVPALSSVRKAPAAEMAMKCYSFRVVMLAWWISALVVAAPVRADAPVTHPFTLESPGEVVATITAGCARCEWGAPGREAVLLELDVDGIYSQHLALIRGERPAPYRVMLGRLRAGPHQLTLRSDTARSAKNAGPATIVSVDVRAFGEGTPEYHVALARAVPACASRNRRAVQRFPSLDVRRDRRGR